MSSKNKTLSLNSKSKRKIKSVRSSAKKSSIKKIRLALAQINPIVGDFRGNGKIIMSRIRRAKRIGADVLLFPELALTGYPPEDLLLKSDFIEANLRQLQSIVRKVNGITVVLGYVQPEKKLLFNAAALVSDQKLLGHYRKTELPNYGVFDEKRYFLPGKNRMRFTLRGVGFGVTICEDIWIVDGPGKSLCVESGVDVLLNISSSPFHQGKGREREGLLRKRARQYNAHIAYVNLVGGQDGLVFDGNSLVVRPDGNVLARGRLFEEDLIVADIEIEEPKSYSKKLGLKNYRITRQQNKNQAPVENLLPHRMGESEEVYSALVLGTKDYVVKNGFKKVLVGLSGGIDSALTATIASRALGPENVIGVLMPSPYSSKGSLDDSLKLADNLNVETLNFPIDKAMRSYESILSRVFRGTDTGIAEENLQARIRGNLLMALSNKYGWLVLTTGNKSEISVGYCTLYGDMAGGFAVIKDLPKTWVYRVSDWINQQAGRDIIPRAIIDKEPSAELRPDQKDTDSLPVYDFLDAVLHEYVENDCGITDLKKLGFSENNVSRIIRMVDQNEYKRRQGPLGIKITPKSFGKDRRLPITNRYSPWKK